MAKRKKTATRTASVQRVAGPTNITVRAPASSSPVRRARKHYRRAVSGIGRAAASEKHTLTAVGSALVFGIAQKSGINIPTVFGLSPEATAGIAAWLWGRMSKNNTAQHVATGLLSVAAHQFARGGVSGYEYQQGYPVVIQGDDDYEDDYED